MSFTKKVLFEPRAKEEYEWWKENDQKAVERIQDLIKDIKIRPFEGLGKPEPLKYQKHGYWSRRINRRDRLVYSVTEDAINVISCKHHYEKY